MTTDHQLSEQRPPQSARRSGMIFTAFFVVTLLGAATWLMMR
jgi:hypothetical protein